MEQDSTKCRDVLALISEYLNLELPAEACAEVEAHLAGCSPCVDLAESLRKTVELCHRYSPDAMPEPLGSAAREELQRAWQKVLEERKQDGNPSSPVA